MLWTYDSDKRQQVKVEAFNGQIGLVSAAGFDKSIYETLRTGYGKPQTFRRPL